MALGVNLLRCCVLGEFLCMNSLFFQFATGFLFLSVSCFSALTPSTSDPHNNHDATDDADPDAHWSV